MYLLDYSTTGDKHFLLIMRCNAASLLENEHSTKSNIAFLSYFIFICDLLAKNVIYGMPSEVIAFM